MYLCWLANVFVSCLFVHYGSVYFSVSMQHFFPQIYFAVVEEVLRSFTEVKVLTPQCKNTPSQVKVLHSKSYLSISTEVLLAKCT